MPEPVAPGCVFARQLTRHLPHSLCNDGSRLHPGQGPASGMFWVMWACVGMVMGVVVVGV